MLARSLGGAFLSQGCRVMCCSAMSLFRGPEEATSDDKILFRESKAAV